jgi:flavodoxin
VDVGIIVYSLSGHTLAVATRLGEHLSALGHNVVLERLETAGPDTDAARVVLKACPDVRRYDAVVFGCPVRGGQPAPPMRSYLERLESMSGKRVACLVTGFFPAAWGRSQTMASMSEICESKGAKICGCASVGWFNMRRHRDMAQAVDELARCLER